MTRPAGFGFLTVCSLLCAAAMAAALVSGESAPVRFAAGATGALALVTAEALAFVRPWAFAASVAFAGSFTATVFVLAGAVDGMTIAMMAPAELFILIALSIVHAGLNTVAQTGRSGPVRVPSPRPPPSTLP